ncbi:MAG: two-component regulator propeller domain-containing protein [Candidatus Poribacteria bacterium]
MSRNFKVLVCLIALIAIEVFFHKPSLAVVNPRYHWRTFTRLDGLAGNNVRAIIQHSSGDIWFATSAGVSRFNGLWQRYTKTEGLADSDVIGIVEADDGSLWFATRNGVSVAVVNPNSDLLFERASFKSFHTNDGLIDNQISAIARDNDGNIWVGTPVGVSIFDGEGWENRQDAEGLLSRGVTAIFAASGGFVIPTPGPSKEGSGGQQMWFGIRASATEFSAVSRFDGQNWVVFTTDDGVPNGDIHAIIEDSIGNIWLGTSNGAARFDGHNWDTFTVADGLAGNNVRAIALDSRRRLWFGTNNGVNVIDIASSFSPQPFERSQLITTEDGLVSDDIQAILEDGTGGIWLGTSSRGVNFSDRSWQIFAIESDATDNFITAINEDNVGNLWVGTLDGLYRLDDKLIRGLEQEVQGGGEWERFTAADGLPGDEVRAITVDKDGDVWVGTERGIGVFDGLGFRQYTQRDGLSSNSVHALAADSAGNIWAAAGVFIGETDPFGRFVGLSKFDGINWFRIPGVDAIMATIFEDSGGDIWVGTFRDGVRVLHGDVIRKFTTTDGLVSNAVSSIIEDATGQIWVGTANGISILSEFEIINLFNTDDGLIDNRVQAICRSSTGEIWVGTSSGVSVTNIGLEYTIPEGQKWITVTVSDGLASNDIGTIFESSDRSLWFGSNDGAVLTRYVREKVPPRTRITNGPKGIVGERSVTFEYEGGDASTPKDELVYSYRIDLDDWSPFTKRTIVRFSNLTDKMEHEFVVRARDKYGNLDRVGDRARFYVDAAAPFVKITGPTDNRVIGGIYDIIGSATDETDFKEYKIEAGPYFSHHSSQPVEDGLLASWDTRNLDDGKYTIRLSAEDTRNGEYDIEHTSSYQVPVIVDNTEPKVEIISPKAGDVYAGKIEIVASLEDIHLDSYTLKYTQTPAAAERQIHFDYFNGAELKYTWDSSNVYGETTLVLEARDKAGNIGVAEVTLNLKNDTARPITRIIQPQAGQVISGEIDVIGTADDSTLSEFTLEYAAETHPDDYTLIKRSNFPIKNDILSVWNIVDISDGDYTLRLTAEDDNRYTNETTISIKIDNTPPIAEIDSPGDGTTLSSGNRTVISGTALDANFDRYILEYSQRLAEQWRLISDSDEPVDGNILGSWNASGFDGEYLLRLTVWDKAGLKSDDVIAVILDDIFPEVQIVAPEEGEILSDVVEIVGTAEDDNFDHYELAFQREGITDYPKSPYGDAWRQIPIPQTSQTTPKKNNPLAVWDTKGTAPLNGDYVILLTAFDKTGHKKSVERTVIVDNKAPEASISQPANYQQVSQQVRIIGTASDENLAEYIIEYSVGESPQRWNPVSETPFLREVRDNLLAVWNTPGEAGQYTVRLRVSDKAQHRSETRITVNVKGPILRSTGGESMDNDANAKLIIPPNSLPEATVITINPAPDIDALPAPSGFSHTGIAYDFEPRAVRFNHIKPATITIHYPESIDLWGNETLALLLWDETDKTFQLIGGTVNKPQKTVAAPVTQLGRYALMRMKAAPNSDVGAPLSDLACQPRVFSPERGECTRISFRLGRASDVTVKIYNMAGRLKRTLQKEQFMSAGGQTLVWEGRDEEQRIVPSGAYIVVVNVADKRMQKSVFVWND